MPTRKKQKWISSKAKRLLRDDIISGAVTADMPAKDVYNMRPEYQEWPEKNFPTNLKNLLTKIGEDYEKARVDQMAYDHDLAHLRTLRAGQTQTLQWHRSDAKWMLIQDINMGKHELMKPAELRLTRAEYQEFDLKTFRNHIYQEVDKRMKRQFRFELKQKRARNTAPS